MTIVLDLDDVLANLRETLYQVLRAETGIDNHWRTWRHYNLSEHFQIESAKLHDLLHAEQVLERCEPEPFAVEFTQELSAMGFVTEIITARGWHENGHHVTQQWLDHHAFRYDRLKLVPLGSRKLDALDPNCRIEWAIDDHPRNIHHYCNAGIPALMIDMPWNQDPVLDPLRVHYLQQIRQRIDTPSIE